MSRSPVRFIYGQELTVVGHRSLPSMLGGGDLDGYAEHKPQNAN